MKNLKLWPNIISGSDPRLLLSNKAWAQVCLLCCVKCVCCQNLRFSSLHYIYFFESLVYFLGLYKEAQGSQNHASLYIGIKRVLCHNGIVFISSYSKSDSDIWYTWAHDFHRKTASSQNFWWVLLGEKKMVFSRLTISQVPCQVSWSPSLSLLEVPGL